MTRRRLARIRCPIGDPSLGKHPQAIAVGVAAEILRRRQGGGRGDAGMTRPSCCASRG